MEELICRLCKRKFDDPQRICTVDGSALTRLKDPIIVRPREDGSRLPSPENRDFDPFRARLSVLIRATGHRSISLQVGDRLVLGRSAESPVASLCGDNISWHHAEIFVDENAAYVVDTDSTNGTFVDGQRISPREPQQLMRTCTICLGADPPLPLTIEVQECE